MNLKKEVTVYIFYNKVFRQNKLSSRRNTLFSKQHTAIVSLMTNLIRSMPLYERDAFIMISIIWQIVSKDYDNDLRLCIVIEIQSPKFCYETKQMRVVTN